MLGYDHDDSRGGVGQSNGRLDLVPVLPAGTSCSESLNRCFTFELRAIQEPVHGLLRESGFPERFGHGIVRLSSQFFFLGLVVRHVLSSSGLLGVLGYRTDRK